MAVLAFVSRVIMGDGEQPVAAVPHMPAPAPEPAVQVASASASDASSDPVAFLCEDAGEGARYYRATGGGSRMLAGFYADGRVRLADKQNRRFAGMIQGDRADLLEIGADRWSELFVRTTPTGQMQLELRGGPYDARVLTCEPLDARQVLGQS